MKIYRVWQNKNNDYDTYDSAVIAASSLNRAKRISIEEFSFPGISFNTWVAKIKDVHATEIGEAKEGVTEGVIVSSFNAG